MFLHGDLQLKILEARNLARPSRISLHGRFQRSTSVDSTKSDDQLSSTFDKRSSRGMYVAVFIAGARVARTQVVPTSQNPVWDQAFNIPLAHPISEMELRLKDKNIRQAMVIGSATVATEIVSTRQLIEQWFPIKGGGEIKLQISFIPGQDNPIYQRGISDNYHVKESYFPVRRGGKLRLYQDAHVMDGMLPEIKLDEEISYEHQKCWEEIYHAILEAQHLVYIVGWSFNHKVKLIREPTRDLPENGNLSLGDLLKAKSRNVRVVLLIWDDKTSHKLLRNKGKMDTHDEETRRFFKYSSVRCRLAARFTNTGLRNFIEQTQRVIYSQHQKCVIVDTQGDGGNNRKLTAFIGGLDLCGGRYDTPEHRLFRDLNTVFKDDYHNPTLDHSKVKGPRQPWHDLHCKIEGAAAYDVLTNLEQRWQKATEWSKTMLLKKSVCGWEDDALIDMTSITNIDHPSTWVSNEDDPESWHIQVFRSIDTGSLKGFSNNANVAYEKNLECDKKVVLDRSIERAYIQAIRSVQHFIYIENQYFIGSSYAWLDGEKPQGVTNLIPMELALKIVNKIRANERFCVYIVIPMWPEGRTTSNTTKEILYWQRQTMRMMYEVVAQELKSAQLVNVKPTDYLNFYCLGNREASSHIGIPESKSQKFGRFMIYVHSKGMIVDDEYVIIGSANINERSMAGSRDTEIAMGAYQTDYLRNINPRGQVYMDTECRYGQSILEALRNALKLLRVWIVWCTLTALQRITGEDIQQMSSGHYKDTF